MTRPPDAGLAIGATVPFARLDLESAAAELLAIGFEAVEVHSLQLGPGLPGVPVHERHAAAAGEGLRAAGLPATTLNAAGEPGFEPLGDREAAVDALARTLRLGAALGAVRVLCWDGRVADPADAAAAPARLAGVVDDARRRAALPDPPAVSVELHPFTFALAHGLVAETAAALREVGAGLCLDFCHFGVALGPAFADGLDDETLAAVNHVHLSDGDCVSSELHLPLGEGVLDVDGLAGLFAGREVALAWDLFSWPLPRAGLRAGFARYRGLVARHAASLATAEVP
jgi:sugar phosphate isomerase/epimerase